MLPVIDEISAQQASPMQDTNKKVKSFMDYAHTYPDVKIRYHVRDMQLYVDSDAVCLILPKARIRGAGHFYLSDKNYNTATIPTPKPNSPILTECQALRNVMLSTAEAEVGIVHLNGKTAIPVRNTLSEMGRPQGPTPIKTDNNTADGLFKKKLKKRPKVFHIKFHWMINIIYQGQFGVYWQRGIDNLAGYFTKHHLPTHHKIMSPKYIHMNKVKLLGLATQSLVQGGVNNIRHSFRRTD